MNVTREVEKVFQSYDNSVKFNAIVYVMKYGVRFTNQEKDAVKEVRCMFGDDVFNRHVIIIMTYGDLFDLDTEEDDRTFEDWCEQQTGDIHKLFEEVDYRIVLFDNKTKDQEKLRSQLNKLLTHAEKIKGAYTNVEFRKKSQRLVELRAFMAADKIKNNAVKIPTPLLHYGYSLMECTTRCLTIRERRNNNCDGKDTSTFGKEPPSWSEKMFTKLRPIISHTYFPLAAVVSGYFVHRSYETIVNKAPFFVTPAASEIKYSLILLCALALAKF
ncbi:Immune-associated nucleotide-binding protein 10 [Bulinus truncatus]|nr:Immune-associated nucleotide-binding protein 10 [Bulinus truncatus]